MSMSNPAQSATIANRVAMTQCGGSRLSYIWDKSTPYLRERFSYAEMDELSKRTAPLKSLPDARVPEAFSSIYMDFVRELHQRKYGQWNGKLHEFLHKTPSDLSIRIMWGDCMTALQGMKSESIGLMVTSPPYYNAREYSQWKNLDAYLADMENIVRESWRVLENHRVFVFNVGDIFDNDYRVTASSWGTRRIPLGAYFVRIFEDAGFTFVDDFIWDKGEVQTERHKRGGTPYPFYQYPANCYEHLMIFHKHREEKERMPCPICGTLKVNGNAYSGVGVKSWECKNVECSHRSAANRGKRFSRKSIQMQSHQTDAEKIPASFIAKWRRDVVRMSPVHKINGKGENTLGHTAPFPPAIPEYAVRMFSYLGDSVLDPFAGSFTTAIEAHKLGRIGMGVELRKKAHRAAIRRNITHQLPLLRKCDIKEYDLG